MLRVVPILVLLAGCATAALPAAFRTGRDPRFPPERFLVGVGEGPTLEIARRRAVASIAAQVEASVRATEHIAAVAGTGADESEHLRQDIRVVSRFDRVAWIRLADAAAEDGRVHALCVLDRAAARALLREEVDEAERALGAALDRAEAGASLRERTAALVDARRLARDLATRRALHAAIAGAPAGPAPTLDRLAALERGLHEARRAEALRICVEPAVSLGVASDVAARFGAILAGTGVRTLPCDAAAEARVLHGRVIATPSAARPQPGSHRRFCAVRLDYRVEGAAGLLAGGSLGGPGDRAGGEDFHQACQASASSVARALAVDLGFADPPAP